MAGTRDTIFALSSGAPPSAIAIVRVSGPAAEDVIRKLAGRSIPHRHATLAALQHPMSGELLDRALLLWFPGPASATGEDLAELHLHGGRATVAAVLAALAALPGCRAAAPGEFTRRAFSNGVMDLTAVEGLADLLSAENEAERRNALAVAEGGLARETGRMREEVLTLSAKAEAALDFEDEDDVASQQGDLAAALAAAARSVAERLAAPSAERLHQGVRVVLAGPVNSGKSTLLNALAQRDAAIVTELPGTTRDIVEAAVDLGGVPLLLMDTAGLREATDVVERIGIDRANTAIANADILLWLGPPEDAPERGEVIRVASRCDLVPPAPGADIAVSAVTGAGMEELIALVRTSASALLSRAGEIALNFRQREALRNVCDALQRASAADDPLIVAEELRLARGALDRLDGRAGVEDMLDRLFAGFCIGK